ncbi:MAG TPA: hypothetical protein VIY09_07275 [Rhizomicrobium sp.]
MTPVWDVLVYVVLPLWVLSGFADYLCHRAAHMECATGARESVFHWLMLGEAGVALAAATWLEVNALVFVWLIVLLAVHEITSHFDGRYATATRRVTVFEFQIHALLEILPLTALLLLAIMHWQQAEALFGFGRTHADWRLVLKPPPSFAVIGPLAAAFFLLAVLPYSEEFWRGLRARRAARTKAPDGVSDAGR